MGDLFYGIAIYTRLKAFSRGRRLDEGIKNYDFNLLTPALSNRRGSLPTFMI